MMLRYYIKQSVALLFTAILLPFYFLTACGSGPSDLTASGQATFQNLAGDIRAIPTNGALTLSWINPNLDLAEITIVYYPKDNPGDSTTLTLPASALRAGQRVSSEIPGLQNGVEYVFRVEAVDTSGRSYNLLEVEREIGSNADGDDVPDTGDNCPFAFNTDQEDADGDTIGDACEAIGVLRFRARANNTRVVDLSWMNPAGSDLRALDLSYGLRDGSGTIMRMDLTALNLSASAAVEHRVSGLAAGTSYTFTLGGVDFRHGRLNQTLPPVSVNVSTPVDDLDDDDDGILDTADNCQFTFNPGQENNDGDAQGDVCDDDDDNDGFLDGMDNCPFFNSTAQADDDGDGIGNVCEARPITDLTTEIHGTKALNLTWVNPVGSVLRTLTLTYAIRDAMGSGTTLDLGTMVNLTANATVKYQVPGLLSGTNYTFALGGVDLRHGRQTQALPVVEVNVSLPPDQDDDDIRDRADNCPFFANTPQTDSDDDGIGDACAARALTNLIGAANGTSAVAARLRWTNPINSDLRALNLSYQRSDGMGNMRELDLSAEVSLRANATVVYIVEGLTAATNYMFILGGVDFRHGRRNQTLPLASVNVSLPPDADADTIADALDNCPILANPGQENRDGDDVGDLCEAEMVVDLIAEADSTTSVNLSWMNPAASVLIALNIIYAPDDDLTDITTLDLSASVNLSPSANTSYRVPGLTSGRIYRFTLGGIDFRQGRINQTLPPASARVALAPDGDLDGVEDSDDNCPLLANQDQDDADTDGIGNACEATSATNVVGAVNGSSAVAVNLSWVNPAGSDLVALNLTYGFSNGTGDLTVRDITSEVDLGASARVDYQISDLVSGVNYTFVVGGIDFRQGVLNQTLPAAAVNVSLPLDGDGDQIADIFDNCPFKANSEQANTDQDEIGDACEAEALLDLAGVVNGTSAIAVNLSWVNPAASVLLFLNISYGLSDGSGERRTVNLTGSLDAAARLEYQISNLMSNAEYTFTLSGVDFRHGILNQTLPAASINLALPPDNDGDRIANFYDNCPLIANEGQENGDGDSIGDVCEAEPVTDVAGVVNGSSAVAVNLSWVNPAASNLLGLNITYGFSNGTGDLTVRDITSEVDLGASARVDYQVLDLASGANYTFIVGGIDFRQGARNQTLPPVSVNVSLPLDRDGDTIADRFDNCPFMTNRDQLDQDDDIIGDGCEARAVLDLTGLVNGTSATTVNLSWVNPARSVLLLLNISYGFSDGSGEQTTVNLTTGLDTAAYQISNLMRNTEYTFTLSGIDFRHGVLNQTLPAASINVTLPPDTDNDSISDSFDNCPFLANRIQADADDDGIGESCEATGATNVLGAVHGASAITVNLSWINPADSALVALNLTYGFRNGTGAITEVDLSVLNLSALAQVEYQVSDLRAGTEYTFTIGGIDFRQGARNQTLPPVSVNVSLPSDRDDDTIADRSDNCPFQANRDQADQDDDGIGDGCEVEGVLDLVGVVNGTSAITVNLSWINPAESNLLALNITYGFSDGSGEQTTVNLTSDLDAAARVEYQITDLMRNTTYTFTVSGIDFRHGQLNQTLPLASVNVSLPLDTDNDTISDLFDNCPFLVNKDQADGDGDDIGDFCEALSVANLDARVNGTSAITVNLTWTNPPASALAALNLTYGLSNGTGGLTEVDLSALNLSASAAVAYQVSDLASDANYMFIIGGIDLRHGALNQTLPPAIVNVSLPSDGDGDTIADGPDNCPLAPNTRQENQDGDSIGDICEATAITGLTGAVNGASAVTVNLTWVNPAGSALVGLNISYGFSNGTGPITTLDLKDTIDLNASARVGYQISALLSNTNYTFTVGGVDLRQGRINQTLPPVAVNVTLPLDTDNDTIANRFDNCPFKANSDQGNRDGDAIGDACEARAVFGLTGVVDDPSAIRVNLSWINPTESRLAALNLTYGLRNGTGNFTEVDLSALNLAAAARAAYRVTDLLSGADYTFIIGGVDFRHGVLNQTLPPAAVNVSLPTDGDNDTIADGFDNCPLNTNTNQMDRDGDGIGDVCEAGPVTNLVGQVNGTSAVTVNLTWANPAESELIALNISYGFSNGTEVNELDITAEVDLDPSARVGYQITDLASNASYTFTLGGIDFRQGVLNQTLPPVAVNVSLPLDGDDDRIADASDNCPFKANSAQANADQDEIGDACEAEALSELAGVVNGTSAITVNLSWVNPAEGVLLVLNLTYGLSDGSDNLTQLNLTSASALEAGTRVEYQITNLMSSHEYTFTVGGIDFRHGVLNQTLPPTAVNVSLPADGDNDTIADLFDNCPLLANHDQANRDGDGIGDACETEAVLGLAGVVNGTSAITVNLTWMNPADSRLVALNITYGFSNGTGDATRLDLSSVLASSARVEYQISDLTPNATYTFVVGGVDLRQGVLNQTLPPVAVNVSLPPDRDRDAIADGPDNCPFKPNRAQANGDGDRIGDACEAEALLGLAGVVNGTSAVTVNLSWVNPAESVLLALNISYGLSDGSGNLTQLNLTSASDLEAAAMVEYQISDLMSHREYTFMVGGVDFRHGVFNQTLPLAAVNVSLPRDGDNDTIADAPDNCPLKANVDQRDGDGDRVGDACEARAVFGLVGAVDEPSAIAVNLSWINPTESNLVALNLTYGLSDGGGRLAEVDLTALNLTAAARAGYRITDLSSGANYTFTIGGIDFRHGVLNQTLPLATVEVSLPTDGDNDTIADMFDNCPLDNNTDQTDQDQDGIGNVCEARPVRELVGVVNGTSAITVNLTWVNPMASALVALNLTYGFSNGTGGFTALDLSALNLSASARAEYQVSSLLSGAEYTFTLGGVDFRQGARNQTLPPAAVNVSLPSDGDGDTIADIFDNCPLHRNTRQANRDGDGIGDVCEAEPVANLVGMVNGTSAITINLTWVNPAGSDLLALNLTYGFSNGSDPLTEVDLSDLDLSAAAAVGYQVSNLRAGAEYTFTLGGIDFRQGARNQTLPLVAINMSLPSDEDGDTVADFFDNCPFLANGDQANADGDGIGNACEAEALLDLAGVVNGTSAITVNLSWVNPAESALVALNLTYGLSDGSGVRTNLNLTGPFDARREYQVTNLMSDREYTFTLGGIDFRHGVLNQTLPAASVNVTLPSDGDGDTIADSFDNCPFLANKRQANADGDGIGNACEAAGVTDLVGMVNGTRAITVNLSWVNPANSNLVALNLTYGFSNGTGAETEIDLSALNLAASARINYQVSDLRAGANYTFTLGGVDFRQGVLNQTLPPVSIDVLLPSDADSDAIADLFDNCPLKANRGQANADDDGIGDACEAEALLDLVGVVNGTSAITVNLTWVNPAESALVALNLTYGLSDGSGVRINLNLTGPFDARREYQVTDLMSNSEYTFTLGGIDFRHGVLNQTLPAASVNVILPLDDDGDTIADSFDNCPFLANKRQANADGDSIGNACEAAGVTDLIGMVNGTRAITVNLSWVNPADSDLVALNLTYGFSNGTGAETEIDLSALNLAASAPVNYQVSDLRAGANYTFTLGGVDFRQGVLNQTLPPVSIDVLLPPDADGDAIADVFDNCPLKANRDQANADGDDIGDACEAEAIMDLVGMVNGTRAITVNLTWVNPAESALVALNLTYGLSDGSGVRINLNLTGPFDTRREYQVTDLMSNSEYTFTLGGIDFRHGVLNQTLPAASINVTLPLDGDGDTIADRFDNCPFLANQRQANSDGDSIGDACEATGVTDLVGMVNGTRAITVNLSWVNPADSDLVALNLTYGFSNGTGAETEIDLSALNLAASAQVNYQVSDLRAGAEYTFTLGGIDFRQGALNQTLPPVSTDVLLPPDADGDAIADVFDNCPLEANRGQANADGDRIGDACEAEAVAGLVGVVNGTSAVAVNLSWVNPAESDLVVLSIVYGLSNGAGITRQVNLTSAQDLARAARVEHQIGDLMSNSEYTFTLGGIDFRHGALNQTLPPVSINVSLPRDGDGDTVTDAADNCPLRPNRLQQNADSDAIGDACEAEGVENFGGVADNPTTVNLSWNNPALSNLIALNLTYGFSNGSGVIEALDLSMMVELRAGESVEYQVSDLTSGASYIFTIGGLDFQHGVLNQTLPLRSTTVLLPNDGDGDGVADAGDNCPALSNPGQENTDGDDLGDLCDPDDDNNGLREIRTAAQLDAARANLSGGYELVADIDLTIYPNWRPLGNRSDPFGGILEGNGHTIDNLKINGSDYTGLFGYLLGATLRNISLRPKDITSASSFDAYLGALAGYSEESRIASSVAVITSPLSSSASFNLYLGGLVGYAYDTEIINSSLVVERDGNFSAFGDESYVGGLLGYSSGSNTSASHTRIAAPILADSFNFSYVGGLIGYVGENSSVNASYADLSEDGNVSSVATNASYIGGLIGYAAASVIHNGYARVNGMVNATANVTSYVGGLIGQVESGVIRHTYAWVNGNLSAVAAESFAGGLIGASQNSMIVNSYYNAPNIQADRISVEGLSRTSDQLRCPTVLIRLCDGAATYEGWDDAIWNLGAMDQLPILRR